MADSQHVSFHRTRARIVVFGMLLCFTACQSVPPEAATPRPTTSVIQQSAIVSVDTETLSPNELRAVSDDSDNQAYVLGPSDIVALQVYQHPELSVPPITGGTSNLTGALITGDGNVNLPLLQTVHLGGLTLEQAEDLLTKDYSQYVNEANITLSIVSPQSLRYYLLGAFLQPGIKYPIHKLNLLEAMALGGGVDLSTADLYQAYVAQGNVKLPIDMHALLVNGDLSQNITLASNDLIVVPSSATENAFVFGAVGKPGLVQFEAGHLSLLQALSVADLDLPNYTSARLSDVRVIRSAGRDGEFIVVNADLILQGKAASFDLEPGDIVFVPPTPVASWNQVLDMLLPSLTTVADILNPFVSIRYLSVTH